MVIGTNGLAPDEAILGRPGHGRKCAAIASWLNALTAHGYAWAKHDPVRIDLDMPSSTRQRLGAWEKACNRYGKVLYAVFTPPTERASNTDEVVLRALTAFIDLFFEERRIEPKAAFLPGAERLRREWLGRALPSIYTCPAWRHWNRHGSRPCRDTTRCRTATRPSYSPRMKPVCAPCFPVT